MGENHNILCSLAFGSRFYLGHFSVNLDEMAVLRPHLLAFFSRVLWRIPCIVART